MACMDHGAERVGRAKNSRGLKAGVGLDPQRQAGEWAHAALPRRLFSAFHIIRRTNMPPPAAEVGRSLLPRH